MKCATCEGSGRFPFSASICPVCDGRGELPDTRQGNPLCRLCNGTGKFPFSTNVCEKCGGWGRLPDGSSIRSQKVQNAEEIITSIKPQTEEKEERMGSTMDISLPSKKIWDEIQRDYHISKRQFGKKFNFATDKFKRKIIFRDVEHAYILAKTGFPKPAVILAGGVIEELLRLYLDHKGIPPVKNTFDSYIKTCENNGLLESAISKLTDSVRHFRNIVHLRLENSRRITISIATAKEAVASIFTLVDDF